MKAYHGTSIGNLINLIKRNPEALYVTDTPERACRYANAQATGIVSADFTELAEGAVIIEMEISDETKWSRRPESHSTLDTCEAYVKGFKIVSATVQFHVYKNTIYGDRHNHASMDEVKMMLLNNGIEVQL